VSAVRFVISRHSRTWTTLKYWEKLQQIVRIKIEILKLINSIARFIHCFFSSCVNRLLIHNAALARCTRSERYRRTTLRNVCRNSRHRWCVQAAFYQNKSVGKQCGCHRSAHLLMGYWYIWYYTTTTTTTTVYTRSRKSQSVMIVRRITVNLWACAARGMRMHGCLATPAAAAAAAAVASNFAIYRCIWTAVHGVARRLAHSSGKTDGRTDWRTNGKLKADCISNATDVGLITLRNDQPRRADL